MATEAPGTPGATYRVQLHAGFGFADAAAVVPYLAELGVTHLYCSPILQAAPGSSHGYDVVDHGRLAEELGGEPAFEVLTRALGDHGMGLVVDIVPNHMATAGRANAWWWDVLENGPSSRYASHFDIDWDPPEAKLRQKVLVPVLGDHYGRVLDRGEVRLRRHGGAFIVSYFEHEVPVSPRTLDELLADAAAEVGSHELAVLAEAFGQLPHAGATDRAGVTRRHGDKEVLRSRLAELCDSRPDVGLAVDAAVERVNQDPDRFDVLLQRQNYRLAYWRVASEELDYRRFFDIPGLIGVRAEDEDVFADSHALLSRLVRDGRVQGLRVDHPDGLRDPQRYLEMLRDATGGAWVVVEKILEGQEALRESWPAAGTTGYDFLNVVGGLFVDGSAQEALSELYRHFAGDHSSFAATALRARLEVMDTALRADIERLTELFVEAAAWDRRFRDYTRAQLRQALKEALASLDVYRTYVRPWGASTEEDRRAVTRALERVRERRPDIDDELLALLERILLGRTRGPAQAELCSRFQQVSGPVMAKGVEDTAFYRYCRLVSLNEVGGDPGRFAVDVDDFHAHNTRAAERWPATLLTTSTHDTKRSEDVRIRVAMLSEIPGDWAAAVERWRSLTQRHKIGGLPDARTEYLLYQTLVGAHPIDTARATAYLEKAVREAKTHTSWTDADEAYEEAVRSFTEAILADGAFREELEGLVGRLLGPARTASLAQTLLRLTSPGVPDTYQGTEVWDLSLVDPDNRRPVDYSRLEKLLGDARSATAEEALARSDDGLPKLLVAHRALALRRARPGAFAPGASYRPLRATGPAARHVVAYGRGDAVVTVVPRLTLTLAEGAGWGDTALELPDGEWTDQLTGARWNGAAVVVGELLGRFPVALLGRT